MVCIPQHGHEATVSAYAGGELPDWQSSLAAGRYSQCAASWLPCALPGHQLAADAAKYMYNDMAAEAAVTGARQTVHG